MCVAPLPGPPPSASAPERTATDPHPGQRGGVHRAAPRAGPGPSRPCGAAGQPARAGPDHLARVGPRTTSPVRAHRSAGQCVKSARPEGSSPASSVLTHLFPSRHTFAPPVAEDSTHSTSAELSHTTTGYTCGSWPTSSTQTGSPPTWRIIGCNPSAAPAINAENSPDGETEACASVARRPSSGELRQPASDAAANADRKSTRLNSSHVAISYAVFCLKKKRNPHKHEPHLLLRCRR